MPAKHLKTISGGLRGITHIGSRKISNVKERPENKSLFYGSQLGAFKLVIWHHFQKSSQEVFHRQSRYIRFKAYDPFSFVHLISIEGLHIHFIPFKFTYV